LLADSSTCITDLKHDRRIFAFECRDHKKHLLPSLKGFSQVSLYLDYFRAFDINANANTIIGNDVSKIADINRWLDKQDNYYFFFTNFNIGFTRFDTCVFYFENKTTAMLFKLMFS
jgi:hypothetical protein